MGTSRCYLLPGVKLFASGEYRGRRWTPADVREMAENAAPLGKLIVPPAAPGHEDDDGWQEFVRTDLPAGGWVYPPSVHAVPDPDPDYPGEMILVGDVVNVPPEMADKIDSGEYRHGSSEIYDDFLDDLGRSRGKTLRKFSYLGGEVPQVKRLGPLPKPVPMAAPLAFSEPRRRIKVRREQTGNTVLTFAETDRMDRTQMIAAIQAAMPGISQATLDAMTDDALADLAKNLPTPTAAAPAAAPAMFADVPREQMVADLVAAGQDQATLEAMPEDELAALYAEVVGEAPAETFGDPATMTRDELIAELTALGQDASALAAMTDDQLREAYAAATGTPPVAAAPAPVTMGERNRRKPATVRQAVAAAGGILGTLHRMSERVKAAEKKADIDPLCADLVRRGFSPAFVREWMRPALERLDNDRPAVTFSEGGRTVRGTAFRAKLAAARQLTPERCFVRFGERAGGAGVSPQTTDAAEAAKVRRFAETLSDAVVKQTGAKTREQFVEKFSELRKKDSSLTAEKYLGPGAVR